MANNITTNADHPLEKAALEAAEAMLEEAGFVFDAVDLTIGFGAESISVSKSKVTASGRRADGLLKGEALITFNMLYLQQNPAFFIEKVVRHEVVHVLNEFMALDKGVEVEPHGEQYTALHLSKTGVAPQSHNELLEPFDNRAIKLHKNQLLIRCNCTGKSGFNLVLMKDRSRISSGERICKACGDPYMLCDISELHGDLKAQFDFIRQEARSRTIYR